MCTHNLNKSNNKKPWQQAQEMLRVYVYT